jgi:membrane protease subunit HflK
VKPKNNRRIFTGALIVLLLAFYLLSGAYSLENGQKALVLRFGEVVKEVSRSGVHFSFPLPFEKTIKVYTSKVQTVSINRKQDRNRERLTGDENLIVVNAQISYDIKNLFDYIYKCVDVKGALQSIGQLCLSRELTGMTVDDVMTTGKSLLRLVLKEKIQEISDEMALGIRIISVEFTDIAPPESVSDAFNSVSNARVKKQEIIKDAEGYANAIIPKARADARTLTSNAEAYSKETLNRAEGSVKAFEEMLAEYERNPGITLNQKMLETMKVILNKGSVKIDTNPSRSVYYINE